MNKKKIAILILMPLLIMSFLSVCYSQLVADTSIISLSGDDWYIKVDGSLETALDSKALPYVSVKSATEKELFLTLNSLKDCQSGVVEFKVDVQGLTAYKQLPLTQKEIDEGVFRPQNVVNSFALFDNLGRKQAHIYASKLIDAKGTEIWLDQDLIDGLLTVYLPPIEVLETLTFPILLDPVIGYSSVGASQTQTEGWNHIYVCRYQVPTNGTISDVSLYCYGLSSGQTVKYVIYSDNSSVPYTLLENETSAELPVSPNQAWINATDFSTEVTEGQYIWIGWQNSGVNVRYWYDSGVTNQTAYHTPDTSPPSSFPSPTYLDYKISIFATYTESGEPTPTPTPTASPTPVPSGSPTVTPFPEGDMSDTDWYVSILILVLIVINLVLMTLPFALVRFVFGILSLFLCMLALAYAIPLSPYLQTAGLLVSVLGMLFAVRARE